jgi:RNA-directed DNA polymerase
MNRENEAGTLHLRDRVDVARLLNVELAELNRVLSLENRARAYTKTVLKKSNGGERQIHSVHGPLKYLQKKLLVELQGRESLAPTGFAHGFVPGRSITTNASHHVRKKLLIKVDIKDFFPSINFPRVRGMFQAFPFKYGPDAANALASLVCLSEDSGILPQGAPTSPYIANMIARKMDYKLAGLALKNKCNYTRYADDITFSTNNTVNVDPSLIVAEIFTIIQSEHFFPNEKKTQILTRRNRQITAGIVVNEGLNINRSYLRSIRATIHNCEKSPNILDQIAREHFKDDRSARTGLIRIGDGRFLKEDWFIADGIAVAHFFQHLNGRIQFARNVVNFSKEPRSQDKYTQERSQNHRESVGTQAVKKLYLRFYDLTVKTAKLYPDLGFLEALLTRQIVNEFVLENVKLHDKEQRIDTKDYVASQMEVVHKEGSEELRTRQDAAAELIDFAANSFSQNSSSNLNPVKIGNALGRQIAEEYLRRDDRKPLSIVSSSNDLMVVRSEARRRSLATYLKSQENIVAFSELNDLSDDQSIYLYCLDRKRQNWTQIFLTYLESKAEPSKTISNIEKVLKIPPESYEKSKVFLRQIDRGVLSKYFHDSVTSSSPFTVNEVILDFTNYFDANYYEICRELRVAVDEYINKIQNFALKRGYDTEISLVSSKGIKSDTLKFQQKIRLGQPFNKNSNCTSLAAAINSQVSKTLKLFPTKFSRDRVVVGEVCHETFFSYVPSICDALHHILRVSLDRLNGDDRIRIDFTKQAGLHASALMVMSIRMRQIENIKSRPGRDFIRGDTSNAIKALIGLGLYRIEGRFVDGKRYVVNMMNGIYLESSDANCEDIVHRVVLDGDTDGFYGVASITKILYIDNSVDGRTKKIRDLIELSIQCELDFFPTIETNLLMTKQYDYIFVHAGNPECHEIVTKEWGCSPSILRFSGGYEEDFCQFDTKGILQVSALKLVRNFPAVFQKLGQR